MAHACKVWHIFDTSCRFIDFPRMSTVVYFALSCRQSPFLVAHPLDAVRKFVITHPFLTCFSNKEAANSLLHWAGCGSETKMVSHSHVRLSDVTERGELPYFSDLSLFFTHPCKARPDEKETAILA
jgi:hypothetical protein